MKEPIIKDLRENEESKKEVKVWEGPFLDEEGKPSTEYERFLLQLVIDYDSYKSDSLIDYLADEVCFTFERDHVKEVLSKEKAIERLYYDREDDTDALWNRVYTSFVSMPDWDNPETNKHFKNAMFILYDDFWGWIRYAFIGLYVNKEGKIYKIANYGSCLHCDMLNTHVECKGKEYGKENHWLNVFGH